MTRVVTQEDDPIALPYTDIEITQSINTLPTPWGQLTQEGFFPDKPLATKFFRIDIKSDIITALPVTNDGNPTIARHGGKDARIFEIQSIDHQDDLLAEDIRGWLALSNNGQNGETFASLFNDRLQTFKTKFNLTLEVMRTSALKGKVTDGAGTVILNVFDAFEITEKVVYFDFSDDTSDIRGQCSLVYRLITQDMSDEVMTYVEARVSSDFFEALINHPKVEKYWLQAEQAQQLANLARTTVGGWKPREFMFGNILFKENPAVVPMWGQGMQPLITAGEGHAYPAGTLTSHVNYVAPPPDIRVLDGSAADLKNMIFITTEMLKHGRGIEMLGRMNCQPIWRRPKLLVHLYSGSGSSTEPLGT